MYYSIRHATRFRYSSPVSESMMEVRMQPRTEGSQRCLNFNLTVSPRSRSMFYKDFLGNVVHHFGVPGAHRELVIVAEALVEVRQAEPLPASLAPSGWAELDRLVREGDYWETLAPSHFAKPSALLRELAFNLDARRRDDPLSLVQELNSGIFQRFDYAPRSTQVDSPIDIPLGTRQGVCQDFAHIMIALLRLLHIPARYVSGYLFHRTGDNDRSSDGATHAWVEALMPHLGWVGFDPTNNLVAGERHIRTAIGRDYFDVPPNRGIFKGEAETKLTVAVRVSPSDAPPPDEQPMVLSGDWAVSEQDIEQQMQEQQQQQQQ